MSSLLFPVQLSAPYLSRTTYSLHHQPQASREGASKKGGVVHPRSVAARHPSCKLPPRMMTRLRKSSSFPATRRPALARRHTGRAASPPLPRSERVTAAGGQGRCRRIVQLAAKMMQAQDDFRTTLYRLHVKNSQYRMRGMHTWSMTSNLGNIRHDNHALTRIMRLLAVSLHQSPPKYIHNCTRYQPDGPRRTYIHSFSEYCLNTQTPAGMTAPARM